MMSWTARAQQRRQAEVFRPLGDAGLSEGWHLIETHIPHLVMLQWRPGTETWHCADGQRWTAECAHELGWRYICPSNPIALP